MTAQTHVADTGRPVAADHGALARSGWRSSRPPGRSSPPTPRSATCSATSPTCSTAIDFQRLTHPDDLATRPAPASSGPSPATIDSYRVTKRYICADGSVAHRRPLGRAAARRRRRARPLHLPDRRPHRAARVRRAPRRRRGGRARGASSKGQAIFEQRVGGPAARRRRRHLPRVQPAPAGAPRHRLPATATAVAPARAASSTTPTSRRRCPSTRCPCARAPRARARSSTTCCIWIGEDPDAPAGAVGLGADGARPLGRPHRCGAGLQRRDRADPGRAGQGRVRVDRLPRAAYAADVRAGLPRAPRRVGRRTLPEAQPAGDRGPAQHAAALPPGRRPDLRRQGVRPGRR